MKAFPTTLEQEAEKMQGMDLRDYFAAKAMQGLINNSHNELPKDWTHIRLVNEAYKIADAMMEARS